MIPYQDRENGTLLGRLERAGRLVNSLGLTTVVVIWVLVRESGYLPTPAVGAIQAHDAKVQTLVAQRVASDREVSEALRQLSAQLGEQNRINLTLLCHALAKDDAGRRACFQPPPRRPTRHDEPQGQ